MDPPALPSRPRVKASSARKSLRCSPSACVVAACFAAVPAVLGQAPPLDVLDCEWDEEWSRFRRLMIANADEGFPVDHQLALEAQRLIRGNEAAIELDPNVAYGASPAMRSFFSSCNSPPPVADPEPACLYGLISALWVIARNGHMGRSILGHAEFLLGKSMRNALDFLESSSWPLSSVDILVNLQQEDQEFKLPQDLKHMRPTLPGEVTLYRSDRQVKDSFDHELVRIVIWEIGVHATLSAEPINMFARMMPRAGFSYRNLIKDQYPQWLPDKCTTLYNHSRLSCDTEEDEITDLFRRRIPHSATSKDPVNDIDDLGEELAITAKRKLNNVDLVICTVAWLCLLTGYMDLPTIGYFGHPLLFLVPPYHGVREGFWQRFQDMMKLPSYAFAVSDPFLQMQYEYQFGAPRLPAIRTHALYTGATHFPSRADEVLVLDRPHEAVLMCVIRRLMPGGETMFGEEDWPLSEGRLRAAMSPGYPYRFITRSMTDKQFKTFAQFRAVVIWPYDMDLITFYEFYAMTVPIFMPRHLSKYIFQQDHMNYNYRWSQREEPEDPMWPPEVGRSPFEEHSPEAVRLVVGFSDYFRFPQVQHFESIPHLLQMLPQTNYFEVVQEMAQYNQDSLMDSLGAWRSLLWRVTKWETEFVLG